MHHLPIFTKTNLYTIEDADCWCFSQGYNASFADFHQNNTHIHKPRKKPWRTLHLYPPLTSIVGGKADKSNDKSKTNHHN